MAASRFARCARVFPSPQPSTAIPWRARSPRRPSTGRRHRTVCTPRRRTSPRRQHLLLPHLNMHPVRAAMLDLTNPRAFNIPIESMPHALFKRVKAPSLAGKPTAKPEFWSLIVAQRHATGCAFGTVAQNIEHMNSLVALVYFGFDSPCDWVVYRGFLLLDPLLRSPCSSRDGMHELLGRKLWTSITTISAVVAHSVAVRTPSSR